MTVASSIYIGSVMHRRLRPRPHRFRYRAFWLFLDLDEVDELSNRLKLFSHNRANIFSFHEADHGDGTSTPLRAQIDRQLAEADVNLEGGRIRLLCMPRTLGYCFNPISVFFCYRKDATLAAVVYQVHNTFGERHSYVIRLGCQSGALLQSSHKLFYVSPFLDMDMRYNFRITGPDERIAVGICASSDEKPVLHAVLSGERKDLTDRNLMLVFLKIPVVTIKVIAAIHWEALRLWAKGVGLRRRPPPPKRPATVITTSSVTAD